LSLTERPGFAFHPLRPSRQNGHAYRDGRPRQGFSLGDILVFEAALRPATWRFGQWEMEAYSAICGLSFASPAIVTTTAAKFETKAGS
jgi:hypothetical protein